MPCGYSVLTMVTIIKPTIDILRVLDFMLVRMLTMIKCQSNQTLFVKSINIFPVQIY